MILVSAALLLAMQTARPVNIELGWDGATCSAKADGNTLAIEAFQAATVEWAKRGRPPRIVGGGDIPYRCIGGIVFATQASGYRAAGPVDAQSIFTLNLTAMVRFEVTRRCAYTVNGVVVEPGALPALAAEWAANRAEIHFSPDPKASYRCVDEALTVLKIARVERLGFIGNELAVEKDQ